MKGCFQVVIALLLCSAFVPENRTGTAAAPPQTTSFARSLTAAGALVPTFVPLSTGASVRSLPAGQGMLDLGRVSFAGGSRLPGVTSKHRARNTVVSTRFSLRLGQANGLASGTATLSAYLLSADGVNSLMVDGVRLSSSPQVIRGQVPVGIVTEHRLEMEIPVSAPPGQVTNLIGWLVIPN